MAGVMSISTNTEYIAKKILNFKANEYQLAIKLGIAHYMSILRVEAVKEIIPDRTGLGPFHDYKYQRFKPRVQPVNPVQLTSRSGRLIAGLKEGGPTASPSHFQNLDKKHSTTNQSVFKSLNGVIDGGGKQTAKSPNVNLFEARWSPFIRTGSDMLQNWQDMFSAKKGSSMTEPKKRLAMRFQHENGIRGNARMFFYPAHVKNGNKLQALVQGAIMREYQRTL